MDYTFTFNQEDLAALNEAIINLPYYKAKPLVDKINSQSQDQGRSEEKDNGSQD